jgi:hypothetical protein
MLERTQTTKKLQALKNSKNTNQRTIKTKTKSTLKKCGIFLTEKFSVSMFAKKKQEPDSEATTC